MKVGLSRLLSAISVGGVALLTEPMLFSCFCASLAASHYVMALLYSRKRIRELTSARWGTALLAAGILVGIGITLSGAVSWALYGILHYLCGDVLLSQRALGIRRQNMRGAICRIAWNTFASLFLFADRIAGNLVPYRPFFLLVALVSLLAFFADLSRTLSKENREAFVDALRFESVLVIALVVSRFHPVSFEALSALHFLLWGALPLASVSRQTSDRGEYLLLTLGITLCALWMTPAFDSTRSSATMYRSWAIASNIHITLSFVLSREIGNILVHVYAMRKQLRGLYRWTPASR